jgi:hypothetical protein
MPFTVWVFQSCKLILDSIILFAHGLNFGKLDITIDSDVKLISSKAGTERIFL